MKRCPKCQTDYPDDANWCRLDGGKLQPIAATPRAPDPQKPGALTMGWDAMPEVSAAQTNPSLLAPDRVPAQPASGPRMPQQPGALTMGWDAVPEPTAPAAPAPSSPQAPQKPGALTMGWDVPEVPQQQTVTPSSLAAQSVETSHAAVAAKASPAATLIGMQAPWSAQAQNPVAPAAQAQAQAPAAQPQAQAYSAQQAPFAQAGPPVQYAPPQMPPPHAPPGFVQPDPVQYAPPQMPQMLQQMLPPTAQPAYDARPVQPSPYAPQVAPQPKYDPNTTLDTRSRSQDDLDKPPKNMLPIYALIGVVVITGLFVAIFLATR